MQFVFVDQRRPMEFAPRGEGRVGPPIPSKRTPLQHRESPEPSLRNLALGPQAIQASGASGGLLLRQALLRGLRPAVVGRADRGPGRRERIAGGEGLLDRLVETPFLLLALLARFGRLLGVFFHVGRSAIELRLAQY